MTGVELQTSAIKAIVYITVACVSLVCGVGAFVTFRNSAMWVRLSCLLAAVSGAIFGVLGFRVEHYRPTIPFLRRAYLEHYRTLFGGIAIGAFVVLCIYGVLVLSTRTNRSTNTSKEAD
jgi:hypothetical protein